MDYNLDRFKRAQEYDFSFALQEVKEGRKRSHWMWYIFPQLKGLGHSGTADYYGISGAEEASAYLADPVLGPRLREICEALLLVKEKSAERIFGYPDVIKLRSSMTLFAIVSEEGSVFQQVLDKYYGGERDEKTINLL